MSSDRPPKKLTTASISAADFPALRSFLRGYFHQDMKEEYGSPEEAVREFCEDASAEERSAVAENWSRFLAQTNGQSIGEINRSLTGQLGSSFALNQENVARISEELNRSTKKLQK